MLCFLPNTLSTCKIFSELASSLQLQTLPLLSLCPISLTLLLLSLFLLYHLPLSSSFSVFLCLFLLTYLPLLSYFLPPSVSTILTFLTLVSTASHILLDTLSSSPLLFSNQFLGCGKQAKAYPV